MKEKRSKPRDYLAIWIKGNLASLSYVNDPKQAAMTYSWLDTIWWDSEVSFSHHSKRIEILFHHKEFLITWEEIEL